MDLPNAPPATFLQTRACKASRGGRRAAPLPSKCIECLGHLGGRGPCRFKDFRLVTPGSSTPSFQSSLQPPPYTYSAVYHAAPPAAGLLELQQNLAVHVLPVVQRSMQHEQLPGLLRRDVERHRVTCDVCMTSIFAHSSMCSTCGLELCTFCHAEEQRQSWPACQQSEVATHQLIPVSRFLANYVEGTLQRLQQVTSTKDVAQKLVPPRAYKKQQKLVHGPLDGPRTAPTLNPNQEDAFRCFWAEHCPVVVENIHAYLQGRWTPDAFVESHGDEQVSVMDSSVPTTTVMTVAQFFELFTSDLSKQKRVVKMKDWPPSANFRDLFPTQFDAFVDAIPMPSYTRHDGYLNLPRHWPFDRTLHIQLYKPDLGPKAYSASPDHLETGSTPLHMDVASAVNLLVHVHDSPPGAPGALWHIFPAHVTRKLREYLREVTGDSSPRDPIHAQTTYLTRSMRDDLIERGIEFFEVFQKLGDAVFIPAGCAHQVSNIRPCIKIACDFVCVEGIPASLAITQEFRAEPREDILNLEAMLWHAWHSIDLQLRSIDESPKPNSGGMRSVWRREHVANRRSQASEARRQGPAAVDRSRDYRCLMALCAQTERRFTFDGIFQHMSALHHVNIPKRDRRIFEGMAPSQFHSKVMEFTSKNPE